VSSRPRRPSRSSLALRWLGIAVLAAVAFAYVHPLRAYFDARSEVDARRADVTALERKHTELEARIKVARTNTFVEREARKLGLVRPGERLFIVDGDGG
jgi:cell division protein FtsB